MALRRLLHGRPMAGSWELRPPASPASHLKVKAIGTMYGKGTSPEHELLVRTEPVSQPTFLGQPFILQNRAPA